MHLVNKKVQLFYEKNSQHMPRSRSMIAKKHLNCSLRDLYTSFKEANPSEHISFSGFCNKKPRNVLSFTKTPHLQCRCELCDNPLMKMKGINKLLDEEVRVSVEGGIDKLVAATLCQDQDRQTVPCLWHQTASK